MRWVGGSDGIHGLVVNANGEAEGWEGSSFTPAEVVARVTSISFLTFFLIYKFAGSLSYLLFPSYRKLSPVDQKDWCSRAYSNVHAVTVTLAVYYLHMHTDVFRDPHPRGMATRLTFRSTPLSQAIISTSLGYFLLDFALVVRHFPHLGDRNMLYHHVLALVSCISGTLQVQGHAFITACLATEFTTPFLNNRWYLDKTGRKTHSIYVINGFGIWLSWLVVRVFMMFLLFVKMWVYLEEIRMTPGICQFLVLLTPTSLFFLNMFWFYKITLGLMKAVRASMNLPPRAGKKVE